MVSSTSLNSEVTFAPRPAPETPDIASTSRPSRATRPSASSGASVKKIESRYRYDSPATKIIVANVPGIILGATCLYTAL